MAREKVIVLLLNYLHWRDTVECVRSLRRCTYSSMKIIIVDNGSPNDSEHQLRSLLPGIEIHQTGQNLGYTGGLNFGYRIILQDRPDYVLILNPDTIVEKGFLEKMVGAMDGHPAAAACCGTILCHPDCNRVWYAGGNMKRWRGLAVHSLTLPGKTPEGERGASQVTFATGCAVLQRVSTIQEIGFQDERFFMYLDDIEYSARTLRKGFSLLYVPEAIVYHRVGDAQQSAFKLYYSVRNRMLLIDSISKGIIRIVARIYFLTIISSKIAVWMVTDRRLLKAATSGLADFFKKNFGEGRGVKAYLV